MEKNGTSLRIATIIALVTISASVVASHYKGIAEAKEYTDEKVDKVGDNIEQIKKDVNQTQLDIAVIKQILLSQNGKRK